MSLKKRYVELAEDSYLCISAQARSTLEFYGVDEKRFIELVKYLFKGCFKDLKFPFHRVLVSKASHDGFPGFPGTPHIRIDIDRPYKKEVEK